MRTSFLMQRAILSVLSLVAFCSVAAILLSAAQSAPAGAPVHPAATYCNPLAIPDYPVGKRVRDIVPGALVGAIDLWLQDHTEQFRELADVTVLSHEGKWYMGLFGWHRNGGIRLRFAARTVQAPRQDFVAARRFHPDRSHALLRRRRWG